MVINGYLNQLKNSLFGFFRGHSGVYLAAGDGFVTVEGDYSVDVCSGFQQLHGVMFRLSIYLLILIYL